MATKAKKKTYRKVYKIDNWGSISYSFSRNGSAEPTLAEGKPVTIKFKDGTEKVKRLVGVPYNTEVGDHGKRYPVSGHLLGVRVEIYGHKMFIELDQVKVAH